MKCQKWTIFNILWAFTLYQLLMKGKATLEHTLVKKLQKTQDVGSVIQQQLKREGTRFQKQMDGTLVRTSADIFYKWRKQVKYYLSILSLRYDGKCSKQAEVRIETLLNLIRGHPGPDTFQYNSIKLSYLRLLNKDQAKYGRINKSDRPKIAIFDPFQSQSHRSRSHLRFLVIDQSGNIEYYRHYSHKNTHIAVSLAQTQSQFNNLLVALPKIDFLKQSQEKIYCKLHKMLRNFRMSDLKYGRAESAEFSVYSRVDENQSNQVKQESSYNNLLNHKIDYALGRFCWIRDFLHQNLLKLGTQLHLSTFGVIFPFVYNIVSSMLQEQGGSFNQQIQNCLPGLELVLRQFRRELRDKKQKNREGHFPATLNNAHVCWRCKSRGFICCSTCSQFQGKTIPLCLDCYELHHLLINKNTQREVVQSTLVRWENVDAQVELLIQQDQWKIDLGFFSLAKKQQCE